MPLVGVIILLIFLIIVIALFGRVLFKSTLKEVITSDEREKILVNISVIMVAGIVGFATVALIEIWNLPTSSLSSQLTIVVLEFIALLTLGGALLSFFVLKALKWVFDVK